MNPLRKTLSTCLLALAGWAVLTGSSTDVFHWDLPAWVPRPVVPADNPMSVAKVELGRHLFYDQRLSADSSMSCACSRRTSACPPPRKLELGYKHAHSGWRWRR